MGLIFKAKLSLVQGHMITASDWRNRGKEEWPSFQFGRSCHEDSETRNMIL